LTGYRRLLIACLVIMGLAMLVAQAAASESFTVVIGPVDREVKPNESVSVIATVKSSNQTPMQGVQVGFSVPSGAVISPVSSATNSTGMASANFQASSPGSYPVLATARLGIPVDIPDGLPGNKTVKIRTTYVSQDFSSLPVTIKVVGTPTLTPTPTPAPTPTPTSTPAPAPIPAPLKPSAEKSTIEVPSVPVNVSAPAQIKVIVRDGSGKPVPDANVILSAEKVKGSPPAGLRVTAILMQAGGMATISPPSGRTGPDGSFTATFSSPSPGEYRITANADGVSFSSSVNVKAIAAAIASIPAVAVNPPQPPGGMSVSLPGGVVSLIVAGISAILLAFLALWFMATRNHLRLIPKKPAVTADGSSVVPIRIQFVNGFGKPRKQKLGREIEMQSTAGEISNVTLPPGRESVEAPLKSSTDCGKVTVTARAGRKVASTDLEFVCSEAGIDLEAKPETIPADGKSSANINVSIKDNKGGRIVSTVDRRVDIRTTLGTVDSPVVIPAGLATATSLLRSGKAGGTAIITATSGKAKGQARVTIGELEKRFCMHCGSRMGMEDALCEKCGQAPPSGVDTKLCANCNTILPEAAKFCYKCGAGQPEMKGG
jgi:ribosomal protein L40E